MVNNSTKFNKTNNPLSTQIIANKKTTTSLDGRPGPGLGQTQRYGGA
jgi:hypothetical protein